MSGRARFQTQVYEPITYCSLHFTSEDKPSSDFRTYRKPVYFHSESRKLRQLTSSLLTLSHAPPPCALRQVLRLPPNEPDHRNQPLKVFSCQQYSSQTVLKPAFREFFVFASRYSLFPLHRKTHPLRDVIFF